ncbi:MAG TPA: hypothetical protein VK614_13665 [Allosphingosinicella sp.]|nr:hypothetical protein [Allosphingosinicella sp.]
MLGFAALAGLLLATVPAPGPSFACRAAAARAERMICADPWLRALDLGVARFYAAARRRPGAVRAQRAWLAERGACATSACLRAALEERLWRLSEAAGRALPAYRDEDADAAMTVAELGQGWYAFGAVGYWHGPTVNSAAASGVFQLQGDRGEIPAATPDDCAYTLTRLAHDRWRLAARAPAAGGTCGGVNATVEGTYIRR